MPCFSHTIFLKAHPLLDLSYLYILYIQEESLYSPTYFFHIHLNIKNNIIQMQSFYTFYFYVLTYVYQV